jgi:alkanesulfonate monooxygenase SsuD/methylene tetrahydromethanopterin reductase-like flavin-dependent oxidoreductase (luciferase family)
MPVSVGVIWPEALAADEPLPDIVGLARVAEQAGLDGVWASDRLVLDEMNVLDAGLVLAAYDVPLDWARQRVLAGTPAQVADQIVPYVQAGADMVQIVCDPVPSAASWERLAEVRQLLNPS